MSARWTEADLEHVQGCVARIKARLEKARQKGQVELHIRLADVAVLVTLCEPTIEALERSIHGA